MLVPYPTIEHQFVFIELLLLQIAKGLKILYGIRDLLG